VRRGERAEPEAVDETGSLVPVQLGEHGTKAPQVRPVKAFPVDLGGRDHPHRDPCRGREHRVIQTLTLLGVDLLRVVQLGERTDPRATQRGIVEEHAGDHEGAGQRSAARLVGARDEARLQAAIEAEESLTRRERHVPRISPPLGRDRVAGVTSL